MCVLLCFGLAQQKFITSQFWRPAVRDQGVHRLVPPEGWEGGVCPPPASRLTDGRLLRTSLHSVFHLYVSLSPSFSFLMYFFSVSVVPGTALASPPSSRSFLSGVLCMDGCYVVSLCRGIEVRNNLCWYLDDVPPHTVEK